MNRNTQTGNFSPIATIRWGIGGPDASRVYVRTFRCRTEARRAAKAARDLGLDVRVVSLDDPMERDRARAEARAALEARRASLAMLDQYREICG